MNREVESVLLSSVLKLAREFLTEFRIRVNRLYFSLMYVYIENEFKSWKNFFALR